MLKLDMNLVFTIINIIVFYFLMKRFLIGPVTAIMEKRKALIDQGLQNAKESQEKALEMKASYESRLAQAKEERKQILEEARKQAGEEYSQTMAQAKKDAAKTMEQARKTVEEERDKAMGELKSQVAILAMAAAASVTGEKENPERDRKLYDQFLQKAGENHEAGSR